MSEADAPQIPPELARILEDPRLDGMKDGEKRALVPRDTPPRPGESPFYLMRDAMTRRSGKVEWVNRTPARHDMGRGRGFALLAETPRFTESIKKPKGLPHAWTYLGWLIASAEFVGVLKQFDSSAIETAAIDWVFADGQRLDGYSFLDVRRQVAAYDYTRSHLIIKAHEDTKHLYELDRPRALKPDLGSSGQIFREAYFQTEIFVSVTLARALASIRPLGMEFVDPADLSTVDFD